MAASANGHTAYPAPAHPLALALFRELRDRSIADKVLVLDTLDRRLGRGDMTEKQERAFHALAQFVKEENHFPSSGEWDRWRSSQEAADARRNTPSGTFIRNASGNWPAARAAFEGASSAHADVLTLRMTALGPEFTDDTLLRAVRAWAANSARPLLLTRFVDWLGDEEAVLASGLGRVPKSGEPFRRFGGWGDVLKAADVADGIAAAGYRGRGRASSGRSPQDEELLFAVRAWAEDCEGVLHRTAFMVWWENACFPQRPELADATRRWQPIKDAFGDWPAVLAAAELAHRSAAAAGRARGLHTDAPDYVVPIVKTDDAAALLACVREAAKELGAAMSFPRFDRWRKGQMDGAALAGQPIPAIPHSQTLRKHFGGWAGAKLAAEVLSSEEAEFERTRQKHPPGVFHDCVRSAMKEYGAGIRPGEFLRWRAAELVARRAHDPDFSIPHLDSVRTRLGGRRAEWAVVVATVLGKASQVVDSGAGAQDAAGVRDPRGASARRSVS